MRRGQQVPGEKRSVRLCRLLVLRNVTITLIVAAGVVAAVAITNAHIADSASISPPITVIPSNSAATTPGTINVAIHTGMPNKSLHPELFETVQVKSRCGHTAGYIPVEHMCYAARDIPRMKERIAAYDCTKCRQRSQK